MTTKPWNDVIILPIAVILMVLGVFALPAAKTSLNGRVCNHSSIEVWLTVTEAGRQKALALQPGQCTDTATQDAEAIWGSDCRADACRYQAWKVGAGHYDIKDDGNSTGFVLRIHGWGAGGRWHITYEWPRPGLSAIPYLLVK